MGGEQINKCPRINNEEKNSKAIKSNLFPNSCYTVSNFMYNTTNEDCSEEVSQLIDR